jgi:hypothetical protein
MLRWFWVFAGTGTPGGLNELCFGGHVCGLRIGLNYENFAPKRKRLFTPFLMKNSRDWRKKPQKDFWFL